jgi:hypothetical protein
MPARPTRHPSLHAWVGFSLVESALFSLANLVRQRLPDLRPLSITTMSSPNDSEASRSAVDSALKAVDSLHESWRTFIFLRAERG